MTLVPVDAPKKLVELTIDGQTVSVTVDPGEQVDDFARGNNTVTIPCPTPGG